MRSSSQSDITSQRTLGLDTAVAIGLAGAIVFFLLSGLVAYFNLQTLREGNDRIVRTHRAIVALNQMLSSMQDAETGQRGFLLTNDPAYLDPYSSALRAIPVKLNEITDLSGDNPLQRTRIGALRQHVDARLALLREGIDLRRGQGFEAALAIVNSDRGKAEMDAIRERLATIADEENRVRAERLVEMETAQRTSLVSSLLTGLLGLVLTITIGFLIRRATLARRREEWLQSGQVGLAAAMMGDQPVEQLGNSLLAFLARYSNAVAGAVFTGSGQGFRRAATYGVPDDARIPEIVSLRDGLLGQAAAEGRPMLVADVPDGYLSFGSALGEGKPRHLAILPAEVDDSVNAVIELGFLSPVDERVMALLKESAGAVAIGVRSATYREELQNLLEETQRQAEELQTQSEELRVSNEELEEQGRALKESQARLELQQVELEQTNSQLEEQAQQLEAQRDDLTRVNASIELKARELEQASRYKSDFLANMSHELRTPLNSSLILAKLLADNPDDNLTDEQVKFAKTIQSSGNDLLNLINDILDLSKIEAGHVEIRPEAIELERLANNLRQLFQPVASERNLEFAIDIAADCPVLIETDRQRLDQVLKNLLSNACKFTEAGRVSLGIGNADDGRIAFAVTDTGIGISADQQKRVFDAFHQADGTISRKYGGTGLGLSISRELVRLLGGSLELRSQEGQGSTFTVTVPAIYDPSLVPAREGPAKTEPANVPASTDAPRSAPGTVVRRVDDDRHSVDDAKRVLLVVEDDESFASILRDLSREMGFRSLVAGTADEALTLASEFMPSAIILDVGLPDQSGLSVLDRLKRDSATRHIPIHVVSGTDQAETAFSLGAVGYEIKPVKREQLVEVLRKFETRLSQRVHRVLIVEDDPVQRDAVAKLLSSSDVETVTAGTAAECIVLLGEQTFDCMVLDLTLPDASGYSLLETLSREGTYAFPPVIVYTGRELSADDEQRLRRYSKSIIIKGAKSPERLLDEVSLFLHQVISDLPDEHQKMIRKARNRDALLEGRRILIVEDDVRNVYALTNILEPRGASIAIARNGREALDALAKASGTGEDPPIDLILMDVMMPVMDGLTATREIRKNPDWKKVPIIALTAKAMPDDQQRCIDAGANDYMAKPLDVEKLLSLVRVWMPK